MQLDQGSVFLFTPQPGVVAPIEISAGSCAAEAAGDGAIPAYLPGARVPVADWRAPTAEERSILCTPTPPPAPCGVGCLRLLGPALTRLCRAHGDSFLTADDAATIAHPVTRMLLDQIAAKGIQISRLHSARLGRDEPGLVTMTRAVDADARIGLHIDRWDGLAPDALETCTNRISINLGPEDRYFLYVNQTVQAMAAMLAKAGIQTDPDVAAIGKAFLAAFPAYPVARLRLKPGDAYIAPTENILHDGSSTGVGEPNNYLSIRGRLDFAAP
jgi:hypothetical protein